uniref:Uncharacterized protein n=1 Tax=Arundo donax TaxID=35708 RepID=A0A0A9B393_ARUDO
MLAERHLSSSSCLSNSPISFSCTLVISARVFVFERFASCSCRFFSFSNFSRLMTCSDNRFFCPFSFSKSCINILTADSN